MSLQPISVLRSVGAVVAGFLVITVGTVFTFGVLVDDFGYTTSTVLEMLLASFGALVSGVAGGLVTAALAARRPLAHAAGLAVPIALDTATIVASAGPESDPIWFDLGGSATLLAGALIGGWWLARRKSGAES